MDEEHFNVKPADPVKSFRQVNLKKDAFEMFGPNGMKGFLGRTDGFMDLSIFKKHKFLRSNVLGKDGSESVGNNLGDDLVETITQRNGAIVIE